MVPKIFRKKPPSYDWVELMKKPDFYYACMDQSTIALHLDLQVKLLVQTQQRILSKSIGK